MSKEAKFGALMDIAKGLDQRGEKDPEPRPIPTPEPALQEPTPPVPSPRVALKTVMTPTAPIPAKTLKVERKLVSTRLPIDLHKRLKRFSLERERNIEDILEQLIESHLRTEGF